MRNSLEQNQFLYSLYYGLEDGTFLQLIKTRGDYTILTTHNAPDETIYILRSIENLAGNRVQIWKFLDLNWKIIEERTEIDPPYDPRQRDWFKNANRSYESVLSETYMFNSLKQLGLTGSRSFLDGTGVFGVDMTLQNLNGFVDQEKPSSNGGILLYDHNKRLLAASSGIENLFDIDLSPLSLKPDKLEEYIKKGKSESGKEIISRQILWNKGNSGEIDITLVSPISDFTSSLHRMQVTILFFSILLLAAVLMILIVVLRKLTAILNALSEDALRVENLDFTGIIPTESIFFEFHRLAQGFHHMKKNIAEKTEELNSTHKRLEMIVDLGIAMAAEKDVNRLVELILSGAKTLSNADGGSVYLQQSENYLDFKIVLNDTLKFFQGDTSSSPITFPQVALYNPDGSPNHKNVVTHCFHTGETVNIEDAYDNNLFDFSGTRTFDERNNYVSHSFLTVPLKPRGGDVIGAIQLINAKDINSNNIIAFSNEIQRFVEALSASAATSLYNRDLLDTQHQLFDSLIKFTAGAIDAKSRHTGGHCKRVPEIALMLAEKAHESTDEYFSDFNLNTPDEWRELRIGAWLHDCGKMTTPEFVVDKATKLETIHNRIHEIRTRFEVLHRDAEINKLKAILAGETEEKAESEFVLRTSELQEEFRFIANCNSGDKFMKPEDIKKVKEIGEQTWVRNFSSNLGLSWEELSRKDDPANETLPVVEPLLADKPYHLIEHNRDIISEYSNYDFTLDIPEYLYNRGEVYNLCIKKGTLNDEERFKINEHVIQTIIMLENLPLPQTMKKVPQYAGTHHEAMNGTGYPIGLDFSNLSIPARIMAIADIFEALTASDRPYKQTKTLSQCMQILYYFKKDGHIDPVLFDLFISSGLYREYAEKYLLPEQLDDFEISQFIG